MHALVAMNPSLSEALNLLLTVPGYGFVTAVSVLAETQGFHGLHSSSQLSAYAGIAHPQINQGRCLGLNARSQKQGMNISVVRPTLLLLGP